MPVLYPNSLDCYAWDSIDLDRPPGTLIGDVSETAVSGQDLIDISTDDSNFISSSTGGSGQSPGFRVQYNLGQAAPTDVDITVRGLGDGSSGYGTYLYVWDNDLGQWDLKDSDTSGSPVYLYANNVQAYAYLDGGDYLVNIRICAEDHAVGGGCDLYYAECAYLAPVSVIPSGLEGDGTIALASAFSTLSLTSVGLEGGGTIGLPAVIFLHTVGPTALVGNGTVASLSYSYSIGGSPAVLMGEGEVAVPSADVAHTISPVGLIGDGTIESVLVFYEVPPSSLEGEGTIAVPVVSAVFGVSPVDLAGNGAIGSPNTAVTHIVTPTGIVGDGVAAPPGVYVEVHLYLYAPSSGVRRFQWRVSGAVYIIVDGELFAESSDGFVPVVATTDIRGILIGYREFFIPHAQPEDIAVLTITGDAGVIHNIDRKLDGDAEWTRVATILDTTHNDGPLNDGLWHYRAVDEDEEGDTATSATEDITISWVPDPPASFDWAWEVGTKTLTFTIGESPSDDVASYRIHESDATGEIDLRGTPIYDGAGLSPTRVFTSETGVYAWLVHTVDSDGYEEKGIERVISLGFENGLMVAIPAEPRILDAYNAEGAKVTVEWLYDPKFEDPEDAGVGFEGRIYTDEGTGSVIYDDSAGPYATEAMGSPTSATRFTWTSPVLPQGADWLWVVRIGTAAWPDGIESQNTHSVQAPLPIDTDVPSTPTLVVSHL